MTLIAGDGNVTLSPILQNFLKPINSPELLQDCFEFSLERLILKIFVGGLSFFVNSCMIWSSDTDYGAQWITS